MLLDQDPRRAVQAVVRPHGGLPAAATPPRSAAA
jgi:hypothetical protein